MQHTTNASAQDPNPGDLVGGKYRVDRVLGQGGMGTVLAAVNVRTDKRVALKYVRASAASSEMALARFAREALAAGRVHHPNVIDVYDVVEAEHGTCLVMEMLDGEALDARLDARGPLPVDAAVEIVIEAARGVAAAHGAGVIHRDLKPANLFLCREPSAVGVKVLDFGVSKLEDDTAGPSTQTGAVVGTPHYMAPEQVHARKDIDGRIDVYALAAVLYEALTGRRPFEGPSVTALLVQIATDPAPPIQGLRSEIPDGLAEVIHRGLAKERDERFADVAAFARALEPFGAGVRFNPSPAAWSTPPPAGEARAIGLAETVASGSTPSMPVTRAPSATNDAGASPRIVLIGGAMLAVVGLAALAWVFSRPAAPPPSPEIEPSATADTEEAATPPPEVPSPEPPPAVEPSPATATEEGQPEPPEPAATGTRRRRASAARSEQGAPPSPEPPPPATGDDVPRAGEISLDDF